VAAAAAVAAAVVPTAGVVMHASGVVWRLHNADAVVIECVDKVT